MARAILKLDEGGTPEFAAALRFLRGRVENTEPLVTSMSKYMVISVRNRIHTTHKAADGTPWPALAAATVIANRYSGDPNPTRPLFRFGKLWSSVKAETGRNNFKIIADAENGKGRTYGDYQNRGRTNTGKGRNTTIPAREFMAFSAENKRRLWKLVRDYVDVVDKHSYDEPY